MKLSKSNRHSDYQTVDEIELFWDWSNQRLKILDCHDLNNINLQHVIELATTAGIGKIMAWAPIAKGNVLLAQGFEQEGLIPGFFAGQDAGCYSYYVNPRRRISAHKYDGIYLAEDSREANQPSTRPAIAAFDYLVRDARPSDVSGMTKLFSNIFSSYPSPVFEADYLLANMRSQQVLYKLALTGNKVIGIASADMDGSNRNAEMTDCATDPQYRGQGILSRLLCDLEADLYRQGFSCLYTLCRAVQPAVNKAFLRLDYTFAGRLINNCNICGGYEDMNLLVKHRV
ncbi:MAG: putative beta-lysine N-acetyltransferase [Syntrophomonadaceae bacterium]|nr:putative beta-lysine N-acetyltransferase [Syntrophomonadaceae bacterium]